MIHVHIVHDVVHVVHETCLYLACMVYVLSYIYVYTGCFIKFDIVSDISMTETVWLVKLSRLNVEQYMNYSSKFE